MISGEVKNLIINDNKEIIRLITSSSDGVIRISDFYSGLFLNWIYIFNQELYGICLWNDNYLFVGCRDTTIKVIEINEGIIIKSLSGHFDQTATINKITHSKYGKCLITQYRHLSKIVLWIIEI